MLESPPKENKPLKESQGESKPTRQDSKPSTANDMD